MRQKVQIQKETEQTNKNSPTAGVGTHGAAVKETVESTKRPEKTDPADDEKNVILIGTGTAGITKDSLEPNRNHSNTTAVTGLFDARSLSPKKTEEETSPRTIVPALFYVHALLLV